MKPKVSDAELKKRAKVFARCDYKIDPAAEILGIARSTLQYSIEKATKKGFVPTPPAPPPAPPPEPPPNPFAIDHAPPLASLDGAKWILKSDRKNKFVFGAFGDLHAASKYTRWDVRADLMKRSVDAGATCIFDTGNWIDGEASFNRYDLEVVGLDAQVKLLAKHYPKVDIPTYAVTGDDHEGWFIRANGIDVGRYCESIMHNHGHKWIDLGYMEADIVLQNSNSGLVSILRVCHPGGGSSYATSYRPQKIIESIEGGEKPGVILFGHYHKLDCNIIRNVYSVQCGTQQDQTPWQRKRSIDAHVGGAIIELEQDPKTGAIISCKPDLRRYYNQSYYVKSGSANNRWTIGDKPKMIPRRVGQS